MTKPSIPQPKPNESGFSTWSLLANNNYINQAINQELATVRVEDYQINEEQLREQAIIRAASVLQLRKNEDGSIEIDPMYERSSGGTRYISENWWAKADFMAMGCH